MKSVAKATVHREDDGQRTVAPGVPLGLPGTVKVGAMSAASSVARDAAGSQSPAPEVPVAADRAADAMVGAAAS